MTKIAIPPIKCQGIKTKLVPLIKSHIVWNERGKWVEPFLGSGVVGFNVRPKRAVFCDSNPHIINLYEEVNLGKISPPIVKAFLRQEGAALSKHGKDYYYEVRERFNRNHSPLDFLFLNRACFNGMIRFNRKGGFNVPYNHKPERFSKAYITKIVNQVKSVYELCQLSDWEFICQDFRETFALVREDDFVYCDPPYIGRHVDYFNSWESDDEIELFNQLSNCPARFILSTWHSNQYRKNSHVDELWSDFYIITKKHFYHVGAKEINRKPVLEALVLNYPPPDNKHHVPIKYYQPELLEKHADFRSKS